MAEETKVGETPKKKGKKKQKQKQVSFADPARWVEEELHI